MKGYNAIRVFPVPALSLINMLLNGYQTEKCNSLLWTEFVLFRCMLWFLAVLLIKNCAVTNPYYEADVIFYQNLLFTWKKGLHGWSCHRGICTSDAVLSDFFFFFCGVRSKGKYVCFSSSWIYRKCLEAGLNFKYFTISPSNSV